MTEDILVCPAKMKTKNLGHFSLFQMLNSTRHGNHSANKRYEDKEGRCNCGAKTYHPVYESRIHWETIIIGNGLPIYLKKRSWILED
jgi:hypothetical protein